MILYDRYPCQEIDPLRVQSILPCKHKESGGKQCERLDHHGDDGHHFGQHVVLHERLGNGRDCETIDQCGFDDTPYIIIGMRR